MNIMKNKYMYLTMFKKKIIIIKCTSSTFDYSEYLWN